MKAWKITQIIGFLLIAIGVVIRVGGEMYGTMIGVLGVLVYAVGRVGTWLKSDKA